MTDSYIRKILAARVYDIAEETPLEPARALSARLGHSVMFKREDLQPVFSFKLRGAYNRMVSLTSAQRAKGVIAASAGNHAQGVALSARKLGVPALIVMPRTTPGIKVQAVRSFGGEVILHGDSYDEAFQHATQLANENGLTFIHPYDDPDVIAGQGTIAMEIVRQASEGLDAIFVPVGGGGLIAGVAVYVKYLCPDVKIIGVEPDDAPTLHSALAAGKRVMLDQVGLFADGVAVKQIGEETFRLAKERVDEVLLVSADETCAAIKDIFDDTRSVMEPSGALSVAGLKKYAAREGGKGKRYAAILSGANMNFDRLRHVAERAALGEEREAFLAVTIPEQPGAFRSFCDLLGTRAITEFNYRYADADRAHVFVGVETPRGASEREGLVALLKESGHAVVDMTDNEVAKLHVRYMVGGRAGHLKNERLFRFQFPERPGALARFLTAMQNRWNISLFHYRNHGADYGRVLVALQVPETDHTALTEFLNDTGYWWTNETDNAAYNLFLR